MGKEKSDAIVTTVMGEKFSKFYDKFFKESQIKFSDKIKTDFVVIDKVIEESKKHSHPSWQKLLMFRNKNIYDYKRVLFIDADVYVTKHAKNPFEGIGDEIIWSMAKNNPYNLSDYAKTDLELYAYCPKNNRPDYMLNAGVFIIKKTHSQIMENIFYEYEEQPCYDNGPFSYHLLNTPNGTILPTEFNVLILCYFKAFGQGLSSVIKVYGESSFIHFAGGPMKSISALYIIKYIDTHPNSVLTRLLYLFGNKRLDFITIPILNQINRIIASYHYRIKKRMV